MPCGELGGAQRLHGTRSGSPGRIVEELRRVGVRNPVFILDEIDRLDERSGIAGALLEAIAPAPGAAFRDRYVDLPFDLSEALFVATAKSLPGYAEAEKRVIATGHPAAVAARIPRPDRRPGPGDRRDGRGDDSQLHPECGAVGSGGCAGNGLRQGGGGRPAEGDESPVEATPRTLAGMLRAPSGPAAEVAARTGRPGIAVGLCRTLVFGGEIMFVEVSRMPGTGMLT